MSNKLLTQQEHSIGTYLIRQLLKLCFCQIEGRTACSKRIRTLCKYNQEIDNPDCRDDSKPKVSTQADNYYVM